MQFRFQSWFCLGVLLLAACGKPAKSEKHEEEKGPGPQVTRSNRPPREALPDRKEAWVICHQRPLVELSISHEVELSTCGGFSYEALGKAAFGKKGYIIVLLSKFLYSFGCLVSYVIVAKDNFAPGLRHLIFGEDSVNDENTTWLYRFLDEQISNL